MSIRTGGTARMRHAAAVTAVLALAAIEGGCTTVLAKRAAPLYTTASYCRLSVVRAGLTAGDLVVELDAEPSGDPRRIHVRVPVDEFYDDVVARRASRWVSSATSPAPGTHMVRVTAAAVRTGDAGPLGEPMQVLNATADSIDALRLDALSAPAAYTLRGTTEAAFAVVLERGGRRQAFVVSDVTARRPVPGARALRVAAIGWDIWVGVSLLTSMMLIFSTN